MLIFLLKTVTATLAFRILGGYYYAFCVTVAVDQFIKNVPKDNHISNRYGEHIYYGYKNRWEYILSEGKSPLPHMCICAVCTILLGAILFKVISF